MRANGRAELRHFTRHCTVRQTGDKRCQWPDATLIKLIIWTSVGICLENPVCIHNQEKRIPGSKHSNM